MSPRARLYTRVGNFKIFSLRVGKVLHAGKLLSGSCLYSFNRFYMFFLDSFPPLYMPFLL